MKIVCRCNDVTLEEIEKLIDEGVTDLEELRRLLRIGMGPCQGRTCIPIVISILARKTGKKPEEISLPNARFPIRPVRIEAFIEEEDEK
ncbi:(2Fe-2S)-binding protein [Pyrococcus horikoshii]|uniref:Dye-linked L-proline dehydrogenase delta2 subunit n=2 Tax=Pyrococcus horikoshii TaxID=53953 RepID=Q5R1N0_PYRHO|nr:(2Fe-2S)-binding protein [Pyrococcus horikoshii]BAD77804.1 dye-linked L-proline dehydrogenase delta2 subunit [Pyrococcus horikoshii OT3]HII60714.1 (2Fe-2S)-binding protein [Pyrococcus horikoshii]